MEEMQQRGRCVICHGKCNHTLEAQIILKGTGVSYTQSFRTWKIYLQTVPPTSCKMARDEAMFGG